MKIKGVSASEFLKRYNKNNSKVERKEKVNKKDSIQISSLGKSLSSYSIDDKFISSKDKIARIKKEVQQGTYNKDSRLVAEKILDHIKNQERK